MAGMAGYPHCYSSTLTITPAFLLSFFVEVLKKPAIPAIVRFSPQRQAENSMAGCCNNLP
jgi:hypothetical protein